MSVEQLQRPNFSSTEDFTEQEGVDTANGIINGLFKQKQHRNSLIGAENFLQVLPVVLERPTSDRISPPEAAQKIEISPDLPTTSPLEKAGFLLHGQMENFIDGLNKDHSVVNSKEELLANMRSHTNEYPLRRPLLEGQARLTPEGIVNSYNNELIRDHLDFVERDGATAGGFLDLDKKALAAQDGDLIIQVSPMGWNGVYADYDGTQIVIHKVKDKQTGELEQLTFVIKGYSVKDCLNLLSALGIDKQSLAGKSERETIKNIVGQAYLLNENIKSAEDLLKVVKTQSSNPKNKIFDAIGRYLKDFSQGVDISKLPKVCEGMLQKVAEFIDQNAQKFVDFATQLQLSDLVEETLYQIGEYVMGFSKKLVSKVLEVAGNILPKIGFPAYGTIDNFNRPQDWRDKYQQVIHKLQQIRGCAGGGKSSGSGSLTSVLGGVLRTVNSYISGSSLGGGAESGGKYFIGDCGRCGRTNVIVGECYICTTCEQELK